MQETVEELSPDRRFVLVRLRDVRAGVPREHVRLELARGRACVLDLADPRCRVESCSFDAGKRALLHLRLSREDGSIVMYPATLDLDSGLYYHGDPRNAHAPAGQAADLEAIARGHGAPGEFDRGLNLRWPDPAQLAQEAWPMPAVPEPAAPAPQPVEPPPDPHRSFDGRWRMEAWTFEDGPEGWQGHARIVDTVDQQTVFDLEGSNWYSRARFNPCAYQLWMNFQHADGRQFLHVFIDLDTLFYWETDEAGTLAPGRMFARLADLRQRLTAVPVTVHAPPSLRLVAAAAPENRTVCSPDGRFRVELFPSGRSETNSRREMKHYYHALFIDLEHGRIIADTRKSGAEAWLADPDGLRMNLAGPAETEVWVTVDLRQGSCTLENFREPLGLDMPLQRLAELLAQTR